MTLEDAIKSLKTEYLGDSYEIREAKDLAIGILEKQIPKEIEWTLDYMYGPPKLQAYCPVCKYINVPTNFTDGSEKTIYCGHCGQKLMLIY